MNRIEIKGAVNTAICYAKVVEKEALEQIQRMCDYPMSEGSQKRTMPDVHWGKGCTIGTTMTITDKVVPNVVGVDIGSGNATRVLNFLKKVQDKEEDLTKKIQEKQNLLNDFILLERWKIRTRSVW